MIPSLALWFDASDPTTIVQSGGTVSQWNDKSSNAYSVIQGTASNRPTYATNLLNGLPGVQLSATTYLYQVGSSMPNFSSSPATTVYMVAKNGSTMPNWNIINTMWFTGISGATQRYHFSFGYLTTNGITLFANGSAVVNPSAYVVPLNSNAIIGFSSSATSNYIFYNGSNTAYASSGALPTANNSTWFLFGDARLSTPPVTDENIYEYLGFNTVLTTAQQQSVEGYLATKWGLQSSLSNGHPYKTIPLPAAPSLIRNPLYPTSAVSNPEFDPRLIPGCQLWLDAKDIFGNGTLPSNGATISSWYDKSGAGNNLTGVNTPTYSTNAVNLSGTAYLSNATPTDAVNTMFFVYNANSGNLGPLFCSQASAGINGFFPNWAATGLMYIAQADGAWYSATSLLPNQLVNIATVQYSGNGNAINVWYNSSNIISTTQTGTITRSVFVLGARLNQGGDTNYFQGQFYEVICFNIVLSTTQRQQVEAYLAKKWKITALSTQNIYAPGSYLTFVNAPIVPALPIRRAVQTNKFLPTQYSNCVLWLDAADRTSMTVSGTSVTQWNDKSGAGNNVVSGNITGTLTYSASSKSISTAGTSNYFFVPVDSRRTVSPNLQVFIVYSWLTSGAGTNQALWGDDDGGWNRLQLLSFPGLSSGADSFALSWGNQGIGFANPPNGVLYTGLNTAAKLIYHASYNQYTTNGSALYLNGANQGSFTDSSANPQTALTNTWFAAIGPASGGAYPSQIEINEIVMYTTTLTNQQRQQLEGYFAWKWGLKSNIGLGHPFFLIPPVPLP